VSGLAAGPFKVQARPASPHTDFNRSATSMVKKQSGSRYFPRLKSWLIRGYGLKLTKKRRPAAANFLDIFAKTQTANRYMYRFETIDPAAPTGANKATLVVNRFPGPKSTDFCHDLTIVTTSFADAATYLF